MHETQGSPEERCRQLLEENGSLREEVGRLDREVKRHAREMRINKRFLDQVTKSAEAKDTLNTALSEANLKQRAYTEMLLQSCPNIIILFDDDGRFVLSTEALMTAAGIPNFDYIKNRKYEEVFPRYFSVADMESFDTAFHSAKSSQEVVRFDTLVDFARSGQPRYYSFELSRAETRMDREDTAISSGILTVMVDLTDFVRERQRAKAANEAKSDFLAVMSHEIRTPMNAIIGMSEMLDRSELNDRQKKYVSDIKKSSGVLLSIINDILDFSKIEAGKMELIDADFPVRIMFDNLCSMFSVLGSESNVDLQFSVDESIPDMIHGDEIRLRQILTNLLSNAIKYTPQGSIHFTARLEDEALWFAVKDTGIGIRAEDQKRLFNPFEQLDVRKNRNVAGTGLGLAVTYNLCRLMDGDLWLESVYGEGSTFYVRLPYMKATQCADAEISVVTDFSAPDARVLVVDDIEINLTVAEALLSTFAIVPDLAPGGREAIDLVKTKCYDMIFMDHMMPEMDGIEATGHIRELGGWCGSVPVIALTANAISGVEQMFLDNRLDDFLPKPVDIASMNTCLRKWLPQHLLVEMCEP